MSESGLFAASTQTVVASGDKRSSPALAAVRPTNVCVNGSITDGQFTLEPNDDAENYSSASGGAGSCL